jgi:hypothetical protein
MDRRLGYVNRVQIQQIAHAHWYYVTLLIVDVESQEIVGISTYPNMGGPGKIDHGTVFRRFQEDLTSFESEQ